MMSHSERIRALDQMEKASAAFYLAARRIGNHPFIEFTGLLNEYIKACHAAHDNGLDFSDCSVHSGQQLPLQQHNITYLKEKLECIFGERISIHE